METTNLTKYGSEKSITELFCSTELTRGTHTQLISLAALNVFLSITAILGNTLVQIAFRRSTSLLPQSKLLVRNLATTDLCVGFMAGPITVSFWISVVKEQWNICHYTLAGIIILGKMLCSVSLLTLTAISVDRLLALLLGLRYRALVTHKRTRAIVTVFWVVSIAGHVIYRWNVALSRWCVYITIPLCLATSIYCYTRIFLRLRQHQTQFHENFQEGQLSQTIPLNTLARYRKAMYSALWLQLTLVACHLPHFAIMLLVIQRGLSSALYVAWQITITLVYLNSSLNPVIYYWRIREVRQVVKESVRRIFCS